MRERFVDALVGILKLDVFTDDRDFHTLLRSDESVDVFFPIRHVGCMRLEVKKAANSDIQAFGLKIQRCLVDSVSHIAGLDHGIQWHVAEESEFFTHFLNERHFCTANENLGLQADFTKLGDALLRGLGLQLSGGLDERHQRHMHDDRIFWTDFQNELTNRF